jgi:hypothetical protein
LLHASVPFVSMRMHPRLVDDDEALQMGGGLGGSMQTRAQTPRCRYVLFGWAGDSAAEQASEHIVAPDRQASLSRALIRSTLTATKCCGAPQ